MALRKECHLLLFLGRFLNMKIEEYIGIINSLIYKMNKFYKDDIKQDLLMFLNSTKQYKKLHFYLFEKKGNSIKY